MRVFISHANDDRQVAGELSKMFSEHGVDSFLADHDIAAGTNWPEQIAEAICGADQLIALLTPSSINCQWVWTEIGIAGVVGLKVVPLTICVNRKSLPAILGATSHRQATPIDTCDARKTEIERIANEIKQCKPRLPWNTLKKIIDREIINITSQPPHGFGPELVIGLGFRGAICASLLVERLRVPVKVVPIRHRANDESAPELDESTLLDTNLPHFRRILIVEWTRVNGRTYKELLRVLSEKGISPPSHDIRSFAVKYDPRLPDCDRPTYSGGECDRDLVGPWSSFLGR